MSELIKRLRGEVCHTVIRECNAAADEIDRLTADIERLNADLSKYGDHDGDCLIGQEPYYKCDCGFLDAISTNQSKALDELALLDADEIGDCEHDPFTYTKHPSGDIVTKCRKCKEVTDNE